MKRVAHLGHFRALLLLGLLVTLAPHVQADDRPHALLTNWAHTAEAQRNRVLDTHLEPHVAAELLAVLEKGVTACDCYPRRLRWAWALPSPRSGTHPAIVVAFTDPPRVQDVVVANVRVAHLRFREGRYVVTSSMLLRRPALSQKASLEVRLLARRDLDEDNQVDIELSFIEDWQQRIPSYCGRARFLSSGEQLVIEEEICAGDPTVTVTYP